MNDWVAVGGTATGERHLIRDEPSEDSWLVEVDAGRAVATVADGHGSVRCARAALGSRLATVVATDCLFDGVPATELGGAVIAGWNAAVDTHLEEVPPTEDEVALSAEELHLLYGTTLLGAALRGDVLTVLQIGDGDVVLGSRSRSVSIRPFGPEGELVPNATRSLSAPDAQEHLRVREIDLGSVPSDVVLMATDGFGSAFADGGWHQPVMSDLIARLAATDPDDLEAVVAGWCREPAKVGGDDTTIALLVRRELLLGPEGAGVSGP